MTTHRGHKVGAIAVLAALLAGVAALLAPLAVAQDDGMIEIPLDTVVRDEPGALVVLDEVAVPAALVGQTCRIESRAENNSSVHPGNDLIVASDGTSVVLADVESEPGKVTTSSDRLTLGSTASVTLRMGEDGVFSGGATALVVIECFVDETTTSTTTTSTTTTTLQATTTTTDAGVLPQAPPAQPQAQQPQFTG